MMTVVSIAKRISLISSVFDLCAGTFPAPSSELRVGDPRDDVAGVNSVVLDDAGRHFVTASSDARQGWTCNG